MKAENVTSDVSLDWYSWGAWTACSTTCGQGVRWRRRACQKDPSTCPQSSRLNGLFYEKTQVQDCQFGACINRTHTDHASVSSGEVGVSIAISAAIIAMVFIVAKALHCLSSPHHQSCCADHEQTSAESPIPAPPTPTTGRDNMTGPVYITITQEMISGRQQVTADGLAPSVVSRSHTDVQVGSTNTSGLNLNMQSTDADSNDLENRSSVDLTDTQSNTYPTSGSDRTGAENFDERDPVRHDLGRSGSDNTSIDRTSSSIQRTDIFIVPSGHGELDQTAHASTSEEPSTEQTEQALAAELAILKPPSYDSLFPLFKRNQTL